jgi:hypothetical protein
MATVPPGRRESVIRDTFCCRGARRYANAMGAAEATGASRESRESRGSGGSGRSTPRTLSANQRKEQEEATSARASRASRASRALSLPVDEDEPNPELYHERPEGEGRTGGGGVGGTRQGHGIRELISYGDAVELLDRAEEKKKRGNGLFASGDCVGALELYAEALELAPLEEDLEDAEGGRGEGPGEGPGEGERGLEKGGRVDEGGDGGELKARSRRQRSVYFSNRAACHLRLEDYDSAVEDCSNAIELDDACVKAYVRRARAFERLEEYDRGLEDMGKAAEYGGEAYRGVCAEYVGRVGPLAEAKREALKEEMLGKLKELGNGLLGHFGLSLDNFTAEQGEDGGYSIKFG